MKCTDQAFKENLQEYLDEKRTKQEKRARMPRFFKRLYSDPHYEAKIEFVQKLIKEIDLIKDEDAMDSSFIELLQSGINGKEGFEYTVIESATSVLYLTLLKKDHAIQDEQKSHPGYKKS